jgi:hypothetical protein
MLYSRVRQNGEKFQGKGSCEEKKEVRGKKKVGTEKQGVIRGK